MFPLSNSLRWQLIAAFLLPTLGLFAVAGGLGYTLSRQILEDELGRSLCAVAAATASQVSAERMLTIEPGDDGRGTRTYRNLLRQLTEIRNASAFRRVFAVDKQGRVRADTGEALPVGAQMPELARDQVELARVFEGAANTSQVLFEGLDGRLYKTGYAPIFQGNQVVGAIGVEATAEFFGPLKRLFRAYAMVVLSTLLLLGLVALLVARGLSRPLARLVASALRIGRGDLETAVPPERTKEIGILARELEVMRNRLESRDLQLKTMLAGVAHEVRNPIGGIELFAGLLAEELDGNAREGNLGEARTHLHRIRGEIAYLKTIVEDFLAFARERRLAKSRIRAEQLLESAAELTAGDAQTRGISLRLTPGEAWIEGDYSLLVSATVNLIRNAIQASSHGGVVELAGRAEDSQYLIEVADRGPGVPAEIQGKIFDPFFSTRAKGSGLGLALAQKIVRAHNGEIEFKSVPGWTVFCVRLPLGHEQRNSGARR